MQMCPNCDRVYDESEYSRCPYCHPYDEDDGRERTVIVYDRDEGRAKYVPESEAEKYNYKDQSEKVPRHRDENQWRGVSGILST